MASRRMTAAERERAVREAAARRSRLSLRLGGLGTVLLFLGGLAVVLAPEWAAYLLVLMVAGIALVGFAFLLLRSSIRDVSGLRAKNL